MPNDTTTVPIDEDDLIDELAQEIRRVDGDHSRGAASLAEALMPFFVSTIASAAQPPAGWREALEFYAQGRHFGLSDESAWDTVSGEPQNFWCDEAGTATIEDGTVAAMALRGTPLTDEETAPKAAPPVGSDAALNTLAQMFHSAEEIEGPDGLAMMVDMSMWNSAVDAFDEISGDSMEPTAPKAEPVIDVRSRSL